MSKTIAPDTHQHPHLDHLFKVGVLYRRSRDRSVSQATRIEAADELARYRAEGIALQEESNMTMTMSGHCQFESPGSHAVCRSTTCDCTCHAEPKEFAGQGIIFAVIDDREKLRTGKVSTISVIADAIESAMDAGHETSETIARYLTTSAFQHIADKRVRFNSILKAGDVVGAHITQKLYTAYNDLGKLADTEKTALGKEIAEAEARGFAEALNLVMSPFSCEDPHDATLVNWDEIDRITESFEKEQRFIRRGSKK